MRVSIVGTGYVGLVTGACLAEQGHKVICVDKDQGRLDEIAGGQSPFYEPGLPEILSSVVGSSLGLTDDLRAAVQDTELTLIAVGTPSRDDGAVDLGAISAVARQLGEAIAVKSDFHTVVVKSTVPPGTTEALVGHQLEQLSGKSRGRDFGLGMNPEFLTEGTAVRDFRQPDRLVIGGADERTLEAQRRLYASFQEVPIIEVSNATAEMIKYMSNALLATMISFSNEFSDLCSAIGNIDVRDVQKGVHLSRYLTLAPSSSSRMAPITSFIEAGCGFGGSCLPKDVKGIASIGKQYGVEMRMMRSVLAVNAERPRRMLEILAMNFETLQGVRVALLGLSFRPDTNDMRESPAIPLVALLLEAGCKVTAYDPQAIEEARSHSALEGTHFAESIEECIDGCDAVVIVTRWKHFEKLPTLLRERANQPLVLDGRRMLEPNSVTHYNGPGR